MSKTDALLLVDDVDDPENDSGEEEEVIYKVEPRWTFKTHYEVC